MVKIELIERYAMGQRDFQGAKLQRAKLQGAKLQGANLRGANLQNTCLDPMNRPNGDVEGFELTSDGWAIGYRTVNSPHVGGPGYVVGQAYQAPVFSTCSTDCHPGIFVSRTIEAALEWGSSVVKVIFRPWECHRAGAKWRVRELIAWEVVR